jgi:hypothetical protein
MTAGAGAERRHARIGTGVPVDTLAGSSIAVTLAACSVVGTQERPGFAASSEHRVHTLGACSSSEYNLEPLWGEGAR